MIDDIVTRLLNIASLKGDIGGIVIPVACYEAADEIERLRIEKRAIKDAYEHLAEISKAQRDTMTKYLFQEEQQ